MFFRFQIETNLFVQKGGSTFKASHLNVPAPHPAGVQSCKSNHRNAGQQPPNTMQSRPPPNLFPVGTDLSAKIQLVPGSDTDCSVKIQLVSSSDTDCFAKKQLVPASDTDCPGKNTDLPTTETDCSVKRQLVSAPDTNLPDRNTNLRGQNPKLPGAGRGVAEENK